MQELCKIDECMKARIAKGYCPAHYKRWRETGDPLTPIKTFRWTPEADDMVMAAEPCPKELNSAMAYGTEIRQVADKLGVSYHAAVQRRAALVREARARDAAAALGTPEKDRDRALWEHGPSSSV